MKVYLQLLILQTILLVVFSALFIGINQKSQQQLTDIHEALETKEAYTFDQLIQLKRDSIQTLARDYSHWQDLMDWMKDPQIDWIKDQFEASLNTYHADLFRIYDATGKGLTPTLNAEVMDVANRDEALPEQLSSLILNRPQAQWFQATFEHTPQGIREVYFAPVQPQSDSNRTGKHYGYLAIARYWDEAFIQQLETLTGSTIEVNTTETTPLPSSAQTTFTRTYHNYQGDTVSTLQISKAMPVATELIEQQTKLRAQILIAFTVGGICLLTFIHFAISRPLQKLSSAMETGDTHALHDITQSKSEFTHLAKLIVENSQQKKQLQTEIEHRRTFEAELLTAKTRAEQANRAKSQFLANISHETRTPLHTISGFSALLHESPLDDDQRATLNHIQDNADHLVKMLSDIIDLSSIEAEEMEPQCSDFNLRELLDEIVAAAHSHASVKHIEIIEAFHANTPEIIRTDYARLRNALLAILDNAIKFTDQGSITLRSSCTNTNDGDALIFEISDTGIGMSEDTLEHIFEPFYQIDDSDSRRYGGGGLGLAIVRGTAQLLGGKIEAQSALGQGSTIRLTLPQHTIASTSAAHTSDQA